MSEKNSGGSAFPEITELVKSTDRYPHYRVWGSEGMTLRDYFAAKAMQAYLTTHSDTSDVKIAEYSYQTADAMLAAREA